MKEYSMQEYKEAVKSVRALKKKIEALQIENADLAFLADKYKADRDALKAQTQDFIEQLIDMSQNLGLYDK